LACAWAYQKYHPLLAGGNQNKPRALKEAPEHQHQSWLVVGFVFINTTRSAAATAAAAAAFLTFLTCCCCCAAPPAMLLAAAAAAAAAAPGCCCCLVMLLPLLLTCILLLLLLLVLLRFALGFDQLTIFHVKQQVFSLQLRNEVQFQSQNEKTGLRGVFFGPF
jgi:hypothetical protein